ncbi:MAG TPA: 3-deoxy-manno-octulosonate cytidylyltransferase [Ignavibacteria bacterium]|nr:3-deoxy-manno-octulosonate cytidylyltransferase [Ignavibacteria bacterium]
MNIVGVIPARWSSKRFPGKPLVMIKGKSMIQRVYEQAKKSKLINRIIIATDDKRIFDEVIRFGGEVMMTSKKHKTGTDRISEVIKNIDGEIIVNIQGDEPYINPNTIDETVKALMTDDEAVVSTPIIKISDLKVIKNPNVVKAIRNTKGYAIYFSRSEIPFKREKSKTEYYKHLGLYVYRKDFLMKLVKMKQTNAEKSESLEQLRILENGYKIKTVIVKRESQSIDTPSDLKKLHG